MRLFSYIRLTAQNIYEYFFKNFSKIEVKKRSKYGVFVRLFHEKIGKIMKKYEVTFINIFCVVSLSKLMQYQEYKNLAITRQTDGDIPHIPFLKIKEAILGKEYELSLLFPKQKLAEELHIQWKKKSGPVNILSFPLDEHSGEIILTLNQARKEAKKFERNYRNHLIFLFIHGCLHLKGMTHGAKMEKEEHFFYKKFSE